MTLPGGPGWISCKERAARAAIGMPAEHPELVTRRPGRGEWKELTAWLAEMWPNDEYAAIVAGTWRQDGPTRDAGPEMTVMPASAYPGRTRRCAVHPGSHPGRRRQVRERGTGT